MTQAAGELYDLGYQHYQGPREGRMRARKAVFVDGFRTTLGLGHGPLAKVLPILLFGAAMAPAVIMAIIASQTEGLLDLPDPADYYEIVSIILIIFSAIIAPELLCPDRRNGVISLYLVRPLTITDYVAGRWLAFFTITLLLVYSGQIVLLARFVFERDSVATGREGHGQEIQVRPKYGCVSPVHGCLPTAIVSLRDHQVAGRGGSGLEEFSFFVGLYQLDGIRALGRHGIRCRGRWVTHRFRLEQHGAARIEAAVEELREHTLLAGQDERSFGEPGPRVGPEAGIAASG